MVGVRLLEELLRAVLEVTEQTAGVAGGGDVVVYVGDERDLLADHLGAAPVGGLENQFLSLGVDPRRVRPGREEFDRVVDRQPVVGSRPRERVLEGLVGLRADVETELPTGDVRARFEGVGHYNHLTRSGGKT